jgi:hypothetical protein
LIAEISWQGAEKTHEQSYEPSAAGPTVIPAKAQAVRGTGLSYASRPETIDHPEARIDPARAMNAPGV